MLVVAFRGTKGIYDADFLLTANELTEFVASPVHEITDYAVKLDSYGGVYVKQDVAKGFMNAYYGLVDPEARLKNAIVEKNARSDPKKVVHSGPYEKAKFLKDLRNEIRALKRGIGRRKRNATTGQPFFPTVVDAYKSGSGLQGICVIGHSLGGALANIFAADLIKSRGRELSSNLSIELITLGSPRVFSAAFGNEIRSKLTSSYRLLNGNDPIPMTPLSYHTKARHIGNVFHRNAEKKWVKKNFRDYHGGFGQLIEKKSKKISRLQKLAMEPEVVRELKDYDGYLFYAPAAKAEADLRYVSRILANAIGSNIKQHMIDAFLDDVKGNGNTKPAAVVNTEPSGTKVAPEN